MLGLDPLYVANEGKLVAVVPPRDAEHLLAVMQEHPLGRNAAEIGEVVDEHRGMVILRSLIGGQRVVTMLAGVSCQVLALLALRRGTFRGN